MDNHIINKVFIETDLNDNIERDVLNFIMNFLIYYRKNKKDINKVIYLEKEKLKNKLYGFEFDLGEEIISVDIYNLWVKYFLVPRYLRVLQEDIIFISECIKFIESFIDTDYLPNINYKYIKLKKDMVTKEQYYEIIKIHKSKEFDFRFMTQKEAAKIIVNK